MSDNKRGKSVLLLYGEATTSLTVKVPLSKKDEIRGKFYDVLKGYENKEIRTVDIEQSDVVVKPKVIKEPYRIEHKLFGTTIKKIAGYSCLLDIDGVTCYWGDTLSSYLVFDDEFHAKDWLTKNKP